MSAGEVLTAHGGDGDTAGIGVSELRGGRGGRGREREVVRGGERPRVAKLQSQDKRRKLERDDRQAH